MKKVTTPAKQKEKPFAPGAADTAILRAVYQYQLLTNEQLVKACGYSPNSLHRVQVLTKRLVEKEYLLSFDVPVVRRKSPLVFSLARKGLNYLKVHGYDVKEYFRPSQEQEKSYLFLQHTLAVNDFLIAASNLHNIAPDFSLKTFIHERVLKRTPYKVKVWQGEKQETVTLIPDAFLLFAEQKPNGKEETIPVLLELDRNTTEQKHFRRNLRARIEFIKEEGYKTLLGTSTVTFAYAVAAGGEKRREELRSWARKEFADTSEQRWLSDLFLFASLPLELDPNNLFLSPLWFTPFDNKPAGSLLE